MTGTDLATVTNPDVPTLVELIDAAPPFALPSGDFEVRLSADAYEAIRASAVALEASFAIARAELETKAEEYMMVFEQLKTLEVDYAGEEQQADMYAKKMHASDDLAAHLYEYLVSLGVELPKGREELEKTLTEVLLRTQRKGDGVKLPSDRVAQAVSTVTTQEIAPLVMLEG